MKKLSEYLLIWAVGGCIYYTFEIVFRGFSHWTMFVLGGLCLVFCTAQVGREDGGIRWESRFYGA